MFCVELIKSCCRMSVGFESDSGGDLWNDEIQSQRPADVNIVSKQGTVRVFLRTNEEKKKEAKMKKRRNFDKQRVQRNEKKQVLWITFFCAFLCLLFFIM